MFMKKIACALTFLGVTLANAGPIEPKKVEQSVNDVIRMKSYDKGGIRLFLVDQQEPAASPYQVVISLPSGGDEFTEYSSFEVGNYCRVNLKGAKSKILSSPPWPTREISIPVKLYDPVTGR